MSVDKSQKEIDYSCTVLIAKGQLRLGFITRKEYNTVNEMHIKKYEPDFKFAGKIPKNQRWHHY